MAIEATILKRKFRFQGIELDDPGPHMKPDDVRDMYAAAYAELTTAEVICLGIENDNQVFEFKKKVGDKG
ncbi:MAG: PRTRC system protein C [Thermomicrobiales bacterium]|nr:MAG: PRTRC system protein C [Thermomicrobiales bacterium]